MATAHAQASPDSLRPDDELMDHAAEDSRAAYSELCVRYTPVLMSTFWRLTNNDAALSMDLTQMTLLNGWKGRSTWPNFRTGFYSGSGAAGQAFGAWVHKTAINLFINHRKKRNPTEPGALDPESVLATIEKSVVPVVIDHSAIRAIDDCIERKLNEKEKAICRLRYWEDVPREKLKEELLSQFHISMSVSAVDKARLRMLYKLKRCLHTKGIDAAWRLTDL